MNALDCQELNSIPNFASHYLHIHPAFFSLYQRKLIRTLSDVDKFDYSYYFRLPETESIAKSAVEIMH
jgi:hypothetical protein